MSRKVWSVMFIAIMLGSAFAIPHTAGAQGQLGGCQVVSQNPKPQRGGIACAFVPVTPFAWGVCSGGASEAECTVTIVGSCTATTPKPTIVGPCIVIPFVKYLCVATWEDKETPLPKSLTCTS